MVFGSVVNGKPGPDSDLDIAVISPDFKGMDTIERMRVVSEARVEAHLLQGPMDIFGYTPEEFNNAEGGTFLGERNKGEGYSDNRINLV